MGTLWICYRIMTSIAFAIRSFDRSFDPTLEMYKVELRPARKWVTESF